MTLTIIPTISHLNCLERAAQSQGRPIRMDIFTAREALISIDLQWNSATTWRRPEPALLVISDATELGDNILSMTTTTEALVA